LFFFSLHLSGKLKQLSRIIGCLFSHLSQHYSINTIILLLSLRRIAAQRAVLNAACSTDVGLQGSVVCALVTQVSLGNEKLSYRQEIAQRVSFRWRISTPIEYRVSVESVDLDFDLEFDLDPNLDVDPDSNPDSDVDSYLDTDSKPDYGMDSDMDRALRCLR